MRHVVALALGLVMLAGAPSDAEGQFRLAGEVGFAQDVDFGIGARGFFPLTSVAENLEIAPYFDLYFPDGFDYWELGGTVYYLFTLPDNPNIIPKVGAGLSIGRFDFDDTLGDIGIPGFDLDASSTEVGLQLLGGVDFPMNSLRPFVEAGVGLGNIADFFVRGGVGFTVGGGS